MKHKAIAVSIAIVVMLCCSLTAFAGSDYSSGTYNGQAYGTTDRCTTHEFYSETGSTSDYLLRVSGTAYFSATAGGPLKSLTFQSGASKKSASVGNTDSSIFYNHITSEHFVNGSSVRTVTVYA